MTDRPDPTPPPPNPAFGKKVFTTSVRRQRRAFRIKLAIVTVIIGSSIPIVRYFAPANTIEQARKEGGIALSLSAILGTNVSEAIPAEAQAPAPSAANPSARPTDEPRSETSNDWWVTEDVSQDEVSDPNGLWDQAPSPAAAYHRDQQNPAPRQTSSRTDRAEASGAASGNDSQTSQDLCTVDHVYDGDTVYLRCSTITPNDRDRVRARLQCIDAPEMDQAQWGTWSRDYLASVLPTGTQATVRVFDIDRYGRPVVRIISGGQDINLGLVEKGVVSVYARYCDDPTYLAAERHAREAKRGIWSRPGSHQRPSQHRNG